MAFWKAKMPDPHVQRAATECLATCCGVDALAADDTWPTHVNGDGIDRDEYFIHVYNIHRVIH
jgi:hypothetical protein